MRITASSALPIVCDRLLIREFDPADSALMADWATDPRYWRYQHVGAVTEASVRAFIDGAMAAKGADGRGEKRHLFDLAVTERETAALVGTVRIAIAEPVHKEAVLGFGFAPSVWGRGYAGEAVDAMIPFAFMALGMHRITAVTDVDNEASHKVLDRAGFTCEGRLRGHRLKLDGTPSGSDQTPDQFPVYSDSLIFGMLAGDIASTTP